MGLVIPYVYFGPLEVESIADDASWFYADETDVTDLIGTDALKKISNEPGAADDTAIDHDRVQRMGELVDQLMDARLAAMGYVTPLVGMSTGTALIMADISAKWVAYRLNEPRMLQSLASAKKPAAIDTIMQEHLKNAELTLGRIGRRAIVITATKNYDTPKAATVYVPTVNDLIATDQALALR